MAITPTFLLEGAIVRAGLEGHGQCVAEAQHLAAGLAYAFYSWATRRLLLRHIPGRAAMGATFGLGGLMLMPVLLEPVVAAALAALLLGERLSGTGWVGVLLIFACLICITWPVRTRTSAR